MYLAIFHMPCCSDEPDVAVIQSLRELQPLMINHHGDEPLHSDTFEWLVNPDNEIREPTMVLRYRHEPGVEGEFVHVRPIQFGERVWLRG